MVVFSAQPWIIAMPSCISGTIRSYRAEELTGTTERRHFPNGASQGLIFRGNSMGVSVGGRMLPNRSSSNRALPFNRPAWRSAFREAEAVGPTGIDEGWGAASLSASCFRNATVAC